MGSADEWPRRRAEILSLFETHVYGNTPGIEIPIRSVPMSEIETLGGRAKRKEIRLYFTESDERPYLDLLIYLPTATDGPSPGIVGLNFQGNHSITSEPDVILSDEWMRKKGTGVVAHCATEGLVEPWPVVGPSNASSNPHSRSSARPPRCGSNALASSSASPRKNRNELR